MGVCNGVSSTCAFGGYALESKCHLGNVILYDTVTSRKWSVNIANHGIRAIVDLLESDFDPENKISVPVAEPEKDCVVSRLQHGFSHARFHSFPFVFSQDCFSWEYGDFK